MKIFAIFLTIATLISCSSTEEQTPIVASEHSSAPALFFPLVEQLAQTLNHDQLLTELDQPITSTTFVWIKDYQLKEQPDAFGYLGLSLEEAVISALKKQGVAVNDYRLKQAIELDGNGSFVLDKNQATARSQANAKYVLAGTIAPIEGGATVTAKVTAFASGDVLSSATVYFPFASQFNRKMTLIDGQLHRN